MLQLIQEFPQCRSLLLETTPTGPLMANDVKQCFTTLFSEEGSNSRVHEEVMYGHFIRYLREIEGKSVVVK